MSSCKKGTLRRKGAIIPFNWSGRDYVLTDNGLERFHPKTGASKGIILFASGACSVRNSNDENGFIVVCGQTETRLKAASAADRADWVADIQRRIDKPAALRAGVQASIARRRAWHAATEAAAVSDAEAWQSSAAAKQKTSEAAIAAKQREEADARQAQNWQAAKEAKEAKEALVKAAKDEQAALAEQAVAAATQKAADVAAAAVGVAESEENKRLLQAKAEGIEAAKRSKVVEIQARKQQLFERDDYAGLQAADAELAEATGSADAALATVQRALAWLEMPAEEARRAGAVMLEGQPAGRPRAEWMGGFELMEPLLAVNGRPVYRAANGADRYFYFWSDSTWTVSNEEDMRGGREGEGADVYSTAAEPDALTPDQVKGSWTVWDGEDRMAACVRQVRWGRGRCSAGSDSRADACRADAGYRR
jgi:hypothetical protein